MKTFKLLFLVFSFLLFTHFVNGQVGVITGETIVCPNSDIIFTLELGPPPTSNHDDVILRTWVVGGFGVGSGNPIDIFIEWSNLLLSKMELINEWDDNDGNHFIKLKLKAGGSNNKIYDSITANGPIDCRITYEWHGQGANQVTYTTAKKIFATDKDPLARMKINGSNNTWAESHSGQNGFIADLSDSESCGEGYKIWLNKRDYWGGSLPNEPWYHQSFSGYPPSNLKLKNVGTALGRPWNPGDNYAVRLTVNGNNIWTEDIHFIRIKQSVSISNVFSFNANWENKTTPSPWGQSNYQYFENTTPLGASLTPVIMLDGTDSQFEDGQFISIKEFNPLTWTAGNTLYSQWYSSTGEIVLFHPLNYPPFNANFIPGQFYMITHAVGPQWDADYHLIKIGPWVPEEEEDTGDPSNRSVDTDDDELFEVWPNPSQGLLNIANHGDSETFNVEVYDLTGKKVLQKEFLSEDRAIVDMSHLAKGAYIISVITSETRQSQKLILH